MMASWALHQTACNAVHQSKNEASEQVKNVVGVQAYDEWAELSVVCLIGCYSWSLSYPTNKGGPKEGAIGKEQHQWRMVINQGKNFWFPIVNPPVQKNYQYVIRKVACTTLYYFLLICIIKTIDKRLGSNSILGPSMLVKSINEA